MKLHWAALTALARIRQRHASVFVFGISLLFLPMSALSQENPSPASSSVQVQLDTLSTKLSAAEERLRQSQSEIDELQRQLAALRAQMSAQTSTALPPATTIAASTSTSTPTVAEVAEKEDITAAEVKQHDQIKVESVSKYPVRLTGLILFNTFFANGSVDQFDLPSFATPGTAGMSNRAFGATIRQTTLGLLATGPRIFGARTNAEVNVDFFGSIPYDAYGTVGGTVRLRTADVRLLWNRDTVEAGMVEPLISPLSPTSCATISEPALSWAGNLWTWAPQISYEHRFGPTEKLHFGYQFGIWDPPTAGYDVGTVARSPSPGDRSGQPAYESRVSWSRGEPNDPRHLQIGWSGYYSRQSYTSRDGDSWATTGDWVLPFGHVFQLSGEFYRGRAIGGLGGGQFKDIISGTNPVTGASTFNLLNAAGGWTQAKVRFNSQMEWNSMFGEDNAFAGDFAGLVLPIGIGGTTARVRNQMVVTNFIYSPKTYLIFSPEYRHILTFPYRGASSTADLFTISIGFRY
jgi:hypothetical protein